MSVSEYIRKHEELSELDFMTVYDTIISLIKDGIIVWNV